MWPSLAIVVLGNEMATDKKTMTLNLTDAEMTVLEKLSAQKEQLLQPSSHLGSNMKW